MRRIVAIGTALAVALTVAACGSDESREDANDVHNSNVEKSAPRVVAFNNHYPNVETKCDADPQGHGSGYRIFVTTHDSAKGQNVIVLPDPQCPGYRPGLALVAANGG